MKTGISGWMQKACFGLVTGFHPTHVSCWPEDFIFLAQILTGSWQIYQRIILHKGLETEKCISKFPSSLLAERDQMCVLSCSATIEARRLTPTLTVSVGRKLRTNDLNDSDNQ